MSSDVHNPSAFGKAFKRAVDLVFGPVGRYWSLPENLKRLARAPRLPRRLLSNVVPPMGAWRQDAQLVVPARLRGVPGVVRDDVVADKAFASGALPHYNSVHAKSIRFTFQALWMSMLPEAPRMMRAVTRALGTASQEPASETGRWTTPSSPAALTKELRREAERLGLSEVGVAPLDEQYTFGPFAGTEVGRYVIVCLLEQNYEATQLAPSVRTELAVQATYADLIERSCDLAQWLNDRGFRARVNDPDGHHVYIHYAVEAGLGQLGLNGQLLTRHAGSRVRMVLIETDASLVRDHPQDFGIPALCDECKVCVRRCPSSAIPPTRKDHRGIEKAKIRTERCLPMVAQVDGCAVCMKTCPVQKYGLDRVMKHYDQTGQVLGKGTTELEGYFWPPDNLFHGPDSHPRVSAAFLNPPGFDFDRHAQPAEFGATLFE